MAHEVIVKFVGEENVQSLTRSIYNAGERNIPRTYAIDVGIRDVMEGRITWIKLFLVIMVIVTFAQMRNILMVPVFGVRRSTPRGAPGEG